MGSGEKSLVAKESPDWQEGRQTYGLVSHDSTRRGGGRSGSPHGLYNLSRGPNDPISFSTAVAYDTGKCSDPMNEPRNGVACNAGAGAGEMLIGILVGSL